MFNLLKKKFHINITVNNEWLTAVLKNEQGHFQDRLMVRNEGQGTVDNSIFPSLNKLFNQVTKWRHQAGTVTVYVELPDIYQAKAPLANHQEEELKQQLINKIIAKANLPKNFNIIDYEIKDGYLVVRLFPIEFGNKIVSLILSSGYKLTKLTASNLPADK